jgi:Transglutaminase-like superfamily
MRFAATRLRKRWKHCLAGSMLLVAFTTGGCNDRVVIVPPEPSGILPPSNPPRTVAGPTTAVAIPSGQKAWLDKESLPPTKWYAQYLNGKCIGFSQFTVAASETQATLLRLTKRDVLEVTSSPTNPIRRREIEIESLELANGQPLSYTEKSSIDSRVTESIAKVEGNVLTITKTADGKTVSKSLPWQAGIWGPFGTLAVLQLQPMQPDEFHEATIFVPTLEKFVKVEFKSKKQEPTTLPGGLVKDLLLIETRFITDAQAAVTKNWVNEAGEIIKSVSQGGFTMFQTTREEAELIDVSIRAAQLLDTKIPIQATIEQLRATSVTFAIDSANVDPFGLLSNKVNQQVTSLSSLGAKLTVHRVIPTAPPPEAVPQDLPDNSCLTKYNSDADALRKFLNEFPEPADNALAIASKLTGGVFRMIEKEPLARNLPTPGQTLKQRRGDCQAHSTLLIAALRERGIPARAASGLRILTEKDNQELFAIYHMWCEAWVGERWLPLDPFAGTIGVGADHIKFSESSLSDKHPLTMMINVLQNMQQLKIAINP